MRFVTALLDVRKIDENDRFRNRPIDYYVELLKWLIKLPVHITAFVDPNYADDISCLSQTCDVIPFPVEELSTWSRRNDIRECRLNPAVNSLKDTHGYMMLQHEKTEFMRRAIKAQYQGAYCWIDAGIYHLCKGDADLGQSFDNEIVRISELSSPERIRIPGCLREPRMIDDQDRLQLAVVNWTFAGGLFAGSSDKLIEFADLARDKRNQWIDQGKWSWEVNLWAALLKDHPELFDRYVADHNLSMLANM